MFFLVMITAIHYLMQLKNCINPEAGGMPDNMKKVAGPIKLLMLTPME
jgi:hypothetical protein